MKIELMALSCLFFLSGLSIEARPKKHVPLKPSGIYGQVVRIGFPPVDPSDPNSENIPDIGARIPIPHSVVAVLRFKDKKEIKRVISDDKGKFKLTLPPGRYWVGPVITDEWSSFGTVGDLSSPDDVTVWKGFYTEGHTVFDGGW